MWVLTIYTHTDEHSHIVSSLSCKCKKTRQQDDPTACSHIQHLRCAADCSLQTTQKLHHLFFSFRFVRRLCFFVVFVFCFCFCSRLNSALEKCTQQVNGSKRFCSAWWIGLAFQATSKIEHVPHNESCVYNLQTSKSPSALLEEEMVLFVVHGSTDTKAR